MTAATSSYPITTGGPGVGSKSNWTFPDAGAHGGTQMIRGFFSQWKTNIYEDINLANLTYEASTTISSDLGLSCSIDGTTTVNYSKSVANNSTNAEWLTFNSNNGTFTGKVPAYEKDKKYSYTISSSWTTIPNGSNQKTVHVFVNGLYEQDLTNSDRISWIIILC